MTERNDTQTCDTVGGGSFGGTGGVGDRDWSACRNRYGFVVSGNFNRTVFRAMGPFLLLPLLMFVQFLPVGNANAGASSGITVSTTAHGIRLTLEVPRRSYPRNALIRVGLRLTNLSHRDMPYPHLRDTEGMCSNSAMEVFNDQGVILYPPAIQIKPGGPTKLDPPCPVQEIGGRQLHPGQTAAGSDLDILRAKNLRATVYVFWTMHARNRRGTTVYLSRPVRVRTPTVQVVLTPSQPLRVSISRLPGHLSAQVQPRARVHGPLYANENSDCDPGGSISYGGPGSVGWAEQSRRTLYPDCPNPSFWYAVVGYLGQPVGSIDYVRPKE